MQKRRASVRLCLVLCGVAVAVLNFAAPVTRLGAQRAAPPGSATGTSAVPREAFDSPIPSSLSAQSRLAAFVEADRLHLDYLPGDVVMKFRAGTSPGQQQRALMALRSRPAREALQWRGDVAVLHDDSQPDATVLAQQLSRQPEVEYAQPNYIRRLPTSASAQYAAINIAPTAPAASPITAVTPNDPDFNLLQWNFRAVNVPSAWEVTPGANASVIVAVVDTGVTSVARTVPVRIWGGSSFQTLQFRFAMSPDLDPSRLLRPVDMTLPLPAALDAVFDFDGHGTHVTSTIVETANNSVGLAGMAYNARFMPVKVCVGYWELMAARAAFGTTGFVSPDAGGCLDDDIAAGIRYAVDNGARVINLSLGGPETSPAVRDALIYAVGRGAFIAISVGNDFDDGNQVEYPAAYATEIDGVMSVGAVGKSLTRASYSNTGSQVEVMAPGGAPVTDGTEDQGYVWQITLLSGDHSPFLSQPRFDRFAEVGYAGTSMASPHVAGVAALLRSESVTSPQTIEAVIKASAKDLGPAGRDDEYGYGLIQARAAVYGLGIR
ncbi:MAG: S8 family serine peptidase [Acidobacteriota bacterium]